MYIKVHQLESSTTENQNFIHKTARILQFDILCIVADQGLFQSAACLLFSLFKTLLNNVYQKLHISKV